MGGSPSRLMLAGVALKMAVLLEFQRALRPGLSLGVIVVPRAAGRNDPVQ
jgi:hypothetical protein